MNLSRSSSVYFAVVCIVAVFCIAFRPSSAAAWQAPTKQKQDGEPPTSTSPPTSINEPAAIIGLTYENPVLTKWKVGVRIVGAASPIQNVFITIPVPNNWPEQVVTMADDDMPATIGNVKFRDLDSGVKQMVVAIPALPAREDITVTMTFRVTTSQMNAPPDTTIFERPKTSHRAGKSYLLPGPGINFRNAKLRKHVKELTADKANIWEEVETIYDWVRDNIQEQDQPPGDTLDVFRDKTSSGEDKVGLFVAMCRAHRIPARMVWVEGTFYAEFMLVDREANAHWFPCNVLGIREFGSNADPRPILQKGDNIRVPEKEARQKFVREFVSCQSRSNSKPVVRFIRELLPADD